MGSHQFVDWVPQSGVLLCSLQDKSVMMQKSSEHILEFEDRLLGDHGL